MNSFDLLKFRNQLLAESISVEENTINSHGNVSQDRRHAERSRPAPRQPAPPLAALDHARSHPAVRRARGSS